MLNIIITYKNHNTINDIYNYINHINNINQNTKIPVEIKILHCNSSINLIEELNYDKKNNIKEPNNVSTYIYHYKAEYSDSIHNELVSFCKYNLILYTELTTYLTEIFFEYLSLNKIVENTFIRANVIELNKIPNEFFENYNNDIFNHISKNIEFLCNENVKNKYSLEEFIQEFNSNTNLVNINNESIIKNNLYYLNNVNDFLLVSKDVLLKHGFNNSNTNYNYTLQFLLLNLIRNKVNMIKLPIMLSVYKNVDNSLISLLDSEIYFISSNEYNNSINYKIYNLNNKKEKYFIRSHIKQLSGIHNNDIIDLNKKLLVENQLLKNKNIENEKQIQEFYNLKQILIEKNKLLEEEKYNLITEKNNLITEKDNIKSQYIQKLNIINSNINELIIHEKNKL